MIGATVREWCGCGAAIHGRKRDVMLWRTSHRHESNEPEPQRQGAFTDHQVGPVSYFQTETPVIEARRIGFTPNG